MLHNPLVTNAAEAVSLMDFPQKSFASGRLAALLAVGVCVAVSGCAVSPFGNELAENAAAQTTGAPMPIEATYVQTVPAPPALPPGAIAAAPATASAGTPTSSSDSSLLSPEEKERVIGELEALAKKQGVELTAERAKADAACNNLSADELRKKMLQGTC